MFGKKKNDKNDGGKAEAKTIESNPLEQAAAPLPPVAAAPDPEQAQQQNPPQFAWSGWPDEIACNIACGELINNIGRLFTDAEGRLHAETLMAAAGALAGWAAQQSLRTRQGVKAVTAETKDGRKLLYGDDLNAMLYSDDRAVAPQCIGNLIFGGALAHGVAQADLPKLHDMFQHVTASFGTPAEGMPSTSESHRPGARADELLKVVIPLAMFCFTREQPHKPGPEARLQRSSWAAVTARAAAAVYNQVATVSPPAVAATIAIESAIYTSKILEDWAVTPRPTAPPQAAPSS
jgi:hypothetical protein